MPLPFYLTVHQGGSFAAGCQYHPSDPTKIGGHKRSKCPRISPAHLFEGTLALNGQNSRTQNILLIVLVGLALVAFRWPSISERIWGDQFPEPAFTWQHHWKEAEKLAAEQNKPLLVVFSASWCPPCKMMKRSVWPDTEVGQAVTAGYVPIYVDVDQPEHAEKVSQYQVSSIPYILVLNSDGSVRKQSNTMSKSEALAFLAN